MRVPKLPVSCIYLVLSFTLAFNNSLSEVIQPTTSDQYDQVEMGLKNNASNFYWINANKTVKKQFLLDQKQLGNSRELFQKYITSLGPEAMLDFLEKKYSHCHGQAHNLGKTLFNNNKNISKSISICGNRCTNACMHGVIGEAFGGQLHQEVTEKMTKYCFQGEMKKWHKPGNCAHGMGHALMMNSNYDLRKSLASCSTFSKGMDYYCASGVYMEYRSKLKKNKPNVKLSKIYPCDKNTDFPAACYRYFMYRIYVAHKWNFYKAVRYCKRLRPHQRRGCFHGIGNMYINNIAKKPSLLKTICKHGNQNDQTLCIEGAIEKLADFNREMAKKACKPLAANNFITCQAAIAGKLYQLNKSSMPLYRPSQ